MRIKVTPNQGTKVSFPKREHRNQDQGNFEASQVKTVNLPSCQYLLSGTTGDVLIRSRVAPHIKQYIENNTHLVDGHYEFDDAPEELKKLLEDAFSQKIGGIHFEDGMSVHEYINRGGNLSALPL